jgi:hypothetical protein
MHASVAQMGFTPIGFFFTPISSRIIHYTSTRNGMRAPKKTTVYFVSIYLFIYIFFTLLFILFFLPPSSFLFLRLCQETILYLHVSLVPTTPHATKNYLA